MSSKVLVRNAADPEQVNDANKKIGLRKDQAEDDLRAVLSTPSGRRFIWSIIGQCSIYDTNFISSSESFARQGRQILGNELITRIARADPEAWLLMQREANKGDF